MTCGHSRPLDAWRVVSVTWSLRRRARRCCGMILMVWATCSTVCFSLSGLRPRAGRRSRLAIQSTKSITLLQRGGDLLLFVVRQVLLASRCRAAIPSRAHGRPRGPGVPGDAAPGRSRSGQTRDSEPMAEVEGAELSDSAKDPGTVRIAARTATGQRLVTGYALGVETAQGRGHLWLTEAQPRQVLISARSKKL